MPSLAPLADVEPPSKNPAGVVVRLPWRRPAYYRPLQRPRVRAVRSLYAPPEPIRGAGRAIGAGVALAALLGGVALGEGRMQPRLAAERETVLAVIHQAREAECQAVASRTGLGVQMRQVMFGPDFAAWEPTLLTEREIERCQPQPRLLPIETHWGAFEAGP